MPTLADPVNDLVQHLMKFADTSESPRRQLLIRALRAVQPPLAQIALPAGLTKEQALRQSLGRIGVEQLQEIAAAVGIREIPKAGKYEIDPGWTESLANYYSHDRITPFPTHTGLNPPSSAVYNLVNQAEIKVALVGDWGTGVWTDLPASDVARRVSDSIRSHSPDYTVHLGDVYYSGSAQEELDKLLALWPGGREASLALNSNHEMYTGGDGYFNTLLKDGPFSLQRGLSYFALQNQYWLIIGLDSAYFAKNSRLYEKGALWEPGETVQTDWLESLLHDPTQSGKRVIILTHHDGFDVDPSLRSLTVNPLWTDVTGRKRGQVNLNVGAKPEISGVHDWYWYWGHVHVPLIYRRIIFDDNSAVSARCIGHGAVPYLPFPRNYGELGDGIVQVNWAETERANTDGDTDRAPNGYALLTLNGPALKEELYDESGRRRWPS